MTRATWYRKPTSKHDASRFDPHDRDDMRYLRQVLVNHMWKVSGIPRGTAPVRQRSDSGDEARLTPEQLQHLMAAAAGGNTRPSLDDIDKRGRRRHLHAV